MRYPAPLSLLALYHSIPQCVRHRSIYHAWPSMHVRSTALQKALDLHLPVASSSCVRIVCRRPAISHRHGSNGNRPLVPIAVCGQIEARLEQQQYAFRCSRPTPCSGSYLSAPYLAYMSVEIHSLAFPSAGMRCTTGGSWCIALTRRRPLSHSSWPSSTVEPQQVSPAETPLPLPPSVSPVT